MTDTTQKPTTELVGDLDAQQPTSAETEHVRGGAGAMAAAPTKTTTAKNGQNDPAQMFQQIMQQLTQGQG